jgi:hypothetical protein
MSGSSGLKVQAAIALRLVAHAMGYGQGQPCRYVARIEAVSGTRADALSTADTADRAKSVAASARDALRSLMMSLPSEGVSQATTGPETRELLLIPSR